jgi:hypothetical protein
VIGTLWTTACFSMVRYRGLIYVSMSIPSGELRGDGAHVSTVLDASRSDNIAKYPMAGRRKRQRRSPRGEKKVMGLMLNWGR